MSRDFDDIYKKIDQSHKELYKQDNELIKDVLSVSKYQEKIFTEIKDLKKKIFSIEEKINSILDILNNFTILLAEEEESENYDTDSNESWIPDQEETWNSYDEDENDD